MQTQNLDDVIEETEIFLTDIRSVRDFCQRYNVELENIGLTRERGFVEQMYYFSDAMGGYTMDAVLGSLKI